MQNIIIFGSTGSIGVNALKVVRRLKDKFRVVGLSARANIELLAQQVKEFSPETVVVPDAQAAGLDRKIPKSKTRILAGIDGLVELAIQKNADIALMAISTSAALKPLLAAIGAKKKIALANKESLVMAGGIVIKKAKQNNVSIIPVDSEHSAIFQCIDNEKLEYVKNIYLTATGGPLRKMPYSKMHLVRPEDAIRHPRWSMGKKISVDSATMMNKGLEVIEAKWLFNVNTENIKILVHPEAVVHSMVEFVDNSVLAQMAVTDMRLPIQYALTYPDRLNSGLPCLDFAAIKRLNFAKPDLKKFPCLGLAFEASKLDGTMPAVLNAVNEELVQKFLNNNIKLTDIAKGVEKVMKKHKVIKDPGLAEILEADKWAREQINIANLTKMTLSKV